VLERRNFKRVGGTKDIAVNLRIISATNQNLDKMVQEGSFREDLYYRLKVVPLYVPPLRERHEDIVPLARLFMERFAKQFKKPFREIAPSAQQVLMDYGWPGNIRELKNLFERTVLLENAELLEARHLKLAARARPNADVTIAQRVEDALNGVIPAGGIPFEPLVEDLERALILRASYATKWNQSRTAELLNLKRDKLRYRMKLFGIHTQDDEAQDHSSAA
jgi:two-component system, NtrC family, response regulator AtoC